MTFEQLKPPQCAQELEERLADLTKLLQSIQKNQRDLPPGHLKIAQKKSHVEYYHITEQGDTKGHYISVKEKSFAARLAQKDYDASLMKLLTREISLLEAYMRHTSSLSEIQKLYENLCPARQSLIKPVTLTDEQYAAQWQKVCWQGKTFDEDAQKFFTAREDCVRSKSEVLIADALFRRRVPYRYEFPLKLRRNKDDVKAENSPNITLHPDFMCLNVRTRQEFYWEHFGMMDDEDYASNAAGKLNLYAENNIFPGRNLIVTMETKLQPLDTRTVEKIIKEFLL